MLHISEGQGGVATATPTAAKADDAERPLRWVVIGSLAIVAFAYEAVNLGLLGQWYDWIWTHTTGEPWTDIIFRHPLMLLLPEAIIIGALIVALPQRRWARVVLVDTIFFLGLLTGHIFWHFA